MQLNSFKPLYVWIEYSQVQGSRATSSEVSMSSTFFCLLQQICSSSPPEPSPLLKQLPKTLPVLKASSKWTRYRKQHRVAAYNKLQF